MEYNSYVKTFYFIVSQKGSNGDGKQHFFGRDYILLALFAQKYILGQIKVYVIFIYCVKSVMFCKGK